MLKRGHWRRNWKLRYFTLTRLSLEYFALRGTGVETPPASGSGGVNGQGAERKGEKKGEVVLKDRNVLVKKHPMAEAQGEYVWRFELHVEGADGGAAESLMCATTTENERAEWIGALEALQRQIAPARSFSAVDSEEDEMEPGPDAEIEGVTGTSGAGA